MKAYKSLDPVNVRLFRTRAVAIKPDRCADSVEQLGRFRTG